MDDQTPAERQRPDGVDWVLLLFVAIGIASIVFLPFRMQDGHLAIGLKAAGGLAAVIEAERTRGGIRYALLLLTAILAIAAAWSVVAGSVFVS